MTTPKTETTGRRAFVKTGAAVAAGLTIVQPGSVFGAPANSAITVGIIGCGGRGRYIARYFKNETDAKVVALSDFFQDRVDNVAGEIEEDAPKKFTGLDSYKPVIESDVDAVVITSPPYFHPEQCAMAVDAGKHVYLAKPVAVDYPGCKSIADSAKKAKGKRSFLVDFQTRVTPFFMEAADRVLRGDIGEIAAGQVFYQTGALGDRIQPSMSPLEKLLRNWVFDIALSGDIIVEQNVHVLDVANWYLKSHPVKAYGSGGQKVRTGLGDCYDHFVVTYWYPNDVLIDFSSGQYLKGFHDMCIRMYGSAGTVDSHYGGLVKIEGKNPWHGTDNHDTFNEGARTNVQAFAVSLKSGEYINNGEVSAESTATGVLGRMAAQRNRMVTWDEMVKAGEVLEPRLDL